MQTMTFEQSTQPEALTIDPTLATPPIGRIVHYVMPGGQCRPAIIVRAWTETDINLQVFTDGPNDGEAYKSGVYWATSVTYSEQPTPHTWHWPEQA